jgi:hypothetical protein
VQLAFQQRSGSLPSSSRFCQLYKAASHAAAVHAGLPAVGDSSHSCWILTVAPSMLQQQASNCSTHLVQALRVVVAKAHQQLQTQQVHCVVGALW